MKKMNNYLRGILLSIGFILVVLFGGVLGALIYLIIFGIIESKRKKK